ncbi:hypothetical protein SHVI106290_13175 [Shewanella violacea]|uniref:Uncharacterized protein n=1 Tax=Shewanella violacea (strain JCM 10179 / CIP 106290 / LMG 19151 / DSS12) TaxID=637905 RepID=D4ZDI0_SHEVD|nr:hypothetical protein SVI_0131 [Shewanella violacea DSS12]
MKLATSSKDIETIYSSFNIKKHHYIEISENENYQDVKQKWLSLSTMKNTYTSNKIDTQEQDINKTQDNHQQHAINNPIQA